MPKYACAHCHKIIARRAAFCPYCGAKRRRLWIYLVWSSIALVIFGLVAWIFYDDLVSGSDLDVGAKQVRQVDQMVQVYVPAGEFQMGSDKGQINDEQPVHTVFLDAYWIDQTEISIGQYEQCVNAGTCKKLKDSSPLKNYPVGMVTWEDASTYCNWVGGRLPTEAEWEKAARGTDERTYPWGEELDCNKANLPSCRKNGPTSVGSYPLGASPYGAMDMAGNMLEWVADWYGENYYYLSADANPLGPETGAQRVLRGGSWWIDENVQSTTRYSYFPDYSNNFIGFRCVNMQANGLESTQKKEKVKTDQAARVLATLTSKNGTDPARAQFQPTNSAVPSVTLMSPLNMPDLIKNSIKGLQVSEMVSFPSNEVEKVFAVMNAEVQNGRFILIGNGYSGGLERRIVYQENTGILFDFQFPMDQQNSAFEFETYFSNGVGDNPGYKRFGIYILPSIETNLWQGQKYRKSTEYLKGDLEIEKGKWYRLLMIIGKEGDFFSIVWDPQDPGKYRYYRQKMGDAWDGLKWRFVVNGAKGRMEVDSFMDLSFVDFSNMGIE